LTPRVIVEHHFLQFEFEFVRQSPGMAEKQKKKCFRTFNWFHQGILVEGEGSVVRFTSLY
jgi:hypothetical protein